MPTLSPPKPHKKYSELVALLKERGMIIPDEHRAKRKLSQIGYYRLSGFWYPCRKGKVDENGSYVINAITGLPEREDNFQENTNFNDIIALYLFDKHLRQLMLDAIERVEIHIRSVIAHEVGRFDPLAYQKESFINPKLLVDKPDRKGIIRNYWEEWSQKQKELIDRSKEDCIVWHKNNNRSIPFWVAIESWDFGVMSKYFTNLKGIYQNKICERIEVPSKKILSGWLQEISILRNRCAHHSRIWNQTTSNAITVFKNDYFNNLNLDLHAKTRIYGLICILWYLVKKIGPNSTWIEKVATLIDEKPLIDCCPYTSMGFPDNQGFPKEKFNL